VSLLIGLKPARGRAYIRHIETAETYTGGRIVIPEQARDKVSRQQFIVVSVGNYEFCDDVDACNRPHTSKGEHRHYLQIGDWVLCRNRAWSSTPDPDVYVINQSDILGTFREE
jgi:co-chaperonin GroES (HSP10)